LALANGDHFVAPDRSNTTHDHNGPPAGCFGSAVVAYRRLHEVALEEACRLGRCREGESRAMAREAAAQHFVTDAFAVGHLRTPVTAIRRFWHHRYPWFWQSLQRKVAADTAAALRELTPPARILLDGYLYQRVLTAVHARTSGYPPITLGDLLAPVFHDWDDGHGLILEGGGHLFGDGHLDQGVGKKLAIAATRAGIDDVEIAYRLGTSGSHLHGEARQPITGASSKVSPRTLERPCSRSSTGQVRVWALGGSWEQISGRLVARHHYRDRQYRS
jgi:hypothetical protein